jgi:hypothetical protein
MPTFAGWNGRIILNGSVTKEYLGTGSDIVSFSKELKEYPITKGANTSEYADNASYVLIYFNQSTIPSGNISGEYSINASLGIVTINESSGGEAIEATYTFYRVIGYATSINFAQDNNLDPVIVIGERNPKEIVEGQIAITGSIEEFFIDRRAWGMVDESTIDHELQNLTLQITPDKDNVSIEYFLRDIKFNTYSLDLTKDGFIMNVRDFSCTNISTA